MLILHLSDIHFREPQCLRPATDPDRTFRTLMVQDVRRQVANLGPVGAILIGGDVAYKGHPDEYVAALDWIKELLNVCGCQLERVFVIPGNHDVDRGIVTRTPAVGNAHSAIFNARPEHREATLRRQFEDPDTSGSLLKPLSAYNNFAKLFNCQIYSPDHLYWRQDLEIGGGVRVRLNGLTSTILSGMNGANDARMGLYLSPLQTGFEPEDDVVHLVMSHHPPDWCMDSDEIEDDVNDRTVIHLFGHKHRQRAILADRFIRIGAAAVNPDRNEAGFEPGYNLIELSVEGAGADRKLRVDAHLRHLQRSPEQYRSRLNGEDPIYTRLIPVPAYIETKGFGIDNVQSSMTEPVSGFPPAISQVDAEAAMGTELTRNLIFRFWQLAVSDRREITLGLGLIDNDDLKIAEPERYGRALLRAGERGLLPQLAAEVEKRERLR